MPRFGDLESHALRLIVEKGDEGILQSELWKKLSVSSREVSRLSLRFKRRDLIERKKFSMKGDGRISLFRRRRTYQSNPSRTAPVSYATTWKNAPRWEPYPQLTVRN